MWESEEALKGSAWQCSKVGTGHLFASSLFLLSFLPKPNFACSYLIIHDHFTIFSPYWLIISPFHLYPNVETQEVKKQRGWPIKRQVPNV